MKQGISEQEAKEKTVLIIMSMTSTKEERIVQGWLNQYEYTFGCTPSFVHLRGLFIDKLRRLADVSVNLKEPVDLTGRLSKRLKLLQKISDWKKNKKMLFRLK